MRLPKWSKNLLHAHFLPLRKISWVHRVRRDPIRLIMFSLSERWSGCMLLPIVWYCPSKSLLLWYGWTATHQKWMKSHLPVPIHEYPSLLPVVHQSKAQSTLLRNDSSKLHWQSAWVKLSYLLLAAQQSDRAALFRSV